DALDVRGEKRTAIVARRESQPLLAGAIGVHEVDFAKVTRIGCETLTVFGRKFRSRISVPERSEHDLFAMRRIRRFGVVTRGAGQPMKLRTVAPRDEDVELFVVIPRIAAFLARRAEVKLGFLFCLGFRVEMGGCEQDFIAVRPEEGASGFANAGREKVAVATLEFENVYLIKLIARQAIAFMNAPHSIGDKHLCFTVS